MVEENDVLESFIDSVYHSCSTDSRNDDMCTSGELFFGIRRECSKLSMEKLSNCLCRKSLTVMDFEDHLYVLAACEKIFGRQNSKDYVLREHGTNDAVEVGKF